jgi:hypothetical protein
MSTLGRILIVEDDPNDVELTLPGSRQCNGVLVFMISSGTVCRGPSFSTARSPFIQEKFNEPKWLVAE